MTRRTDEEKERKAIELYSDEERKLSLQRVAEQLGITHTTVRHILLRNNVPRRSISEANIKYQKTNFSGDTKERARIIGFINDCWIGYKSRQIGVETSTTHPAQIELFNEIFGRYGHVGKYPTYNRQFSLYQWKLQVLVNDSFEFLMEYKTNPLKILDEIAENDAYDCVAGQADAEG